MEPDVYYSPFSRMWKDRNFDLKHDEVEDVAAVLEAIEEQQPPEPERKPIYSYDYDAGLSALKTVRKYDKGMYEVLKSLQLKNDKRWIEQAVDYENRILTRKEERRDAKTPVWSREKALEKGRA